MILQTCSIHLLPGFEQGTNQHAYQTSRNASSEHLVQVRLSDKGRLTAMCWFSSP